MKSFKKLLCLLLALCLTVQLLPLSAFAADFKEPFPLPELSGNSRMDFVAVAKSQLGYEEAEDGSSYFGDWAGQTYSGWCSEFAAWCAAQAGIPKSIIPKAKSTSGCRI